MKKLIMIASMLLALSSYATVTTSVDINATLEVIEMLNVDFTDTNLDFGTVVAVSGAHNTLNSIDMTVTGASTSYAAYVQLPTHVNITNGAESIRVTTVVDARSGGTATVEGANHIIRSTSGVAPNMAINISGNMTLAGTEALGTYHGTMNVIAKYE